MNDLEVDYTILSDPTGIELSEHLGFTNYAGETTTIVSTTADAGGLIKVEVEHLWTDQPGDASWLLTEVVEIGVGGLTGTWDVAGKEVWSQCTDPMDNGSISGRGKVTFVQKGETFTGFGNFPRTSDVIDGNVVRTGEDEFRLTGDVNYTEDWGECDDGVCYEWIVSGSAEFSGIGSVQNQSIAFEWNGRDTSGDTCVFTGSGTGSRR